MSLAAWRADIIERLANGDGTTPGFGINQVYQESVPEQSRLERMSDGRVRPYVSVWFGQRIGMGNGYRGICGVRMNAHRMNMIIMVGAPDGNTANKARDLISELLWGFRPAGQGELEETSSTTIRRPLDISGVDSRNAVPIAYSGTVDI